MLASLILIVLIITFAIVISIKFLEQRESDIRWKKLKAVFPSDLHEAKKLAFDRQQSWKITALEKLSNHGNMTGTQKALVDWLVAGEWIVEQQENLKVPEPVINALEAFLIDDHANIEELDLYQEVLSTFFRFYKSSAFTHKVLLSDALIKLGTFSKAHFWRPAIQFLSMSPSDGKVLFASG
ncbi:hypothetical protein ACHMW6_24060 [Pseudoduganella sp. UC29_106]|uniref:hypothetical protein n=1 Tax=Pseudoduganella sp. UC29_106 TaxID=3374553 RepID=UPI0037575C19